MNPAWLVRNIRHSMTACPTWPDRLQLLRLRYARKLPAWAKPESGRAIAFRFPEPVGRIDVAVRDNNGSDQFILSEVFEHRCYDADLPFSPGTILDLGANAGYTAVYFGRKYPDARIACVEPMPGNVAILRRNLTLNGIRCEVFAAAVTTADGPVAMAVADMDYGHAVAAGDAPPAGRTVSCEGVSVPSLLSRLGWDRVGLLKIDIEGYEARLLKERCDWLARVDAICVECHPGYGEADLTELAAGHGFDAPVRRHGLWWLSRRAT